MRQSEPIIFTRSRYHLAVTLLIPHLKRKKRFDETDSHDNVLYSD
jgi:hypothetical protein